MSTVEEIESKREELGRNGVTILKETCVTSLNPKICLGTSVKGGGRGLYAKLAIAKGEWVWRDVPGYDATPRTWDFIKALPELARRNFLHYCYAVGDNKFLACHEFDITPMEEWSDVRPSDDSMYMNHSCEPTCWFSYPDRKVTESCRYMTATRDIAAGEEITFDYGTSEAHPEWPGFACKCGSPECRGVVTPDDWRLMSLQSKYSGHFLRHVAEKIALWQSSSEFALEVKFSSNVGRYIAVGKPVPAGALLMVLPPNLLLTEAELENPEQVLQVAPDLFSSSITVDDLDNFLNHACEPSTTFTLREDYTILLHASRDLLPGDAITIDYEEHEDDLVCQGSDFMCACGSSACRGHIIGAALRAGLPAPADEGKTKPTALYAATAVNGEQITPGFTSSAGAGAPAAADD